MTPTITGFRLHNVIVKKMCSRCRKDLAFKCHSRRFERDRIEQMCIWINKILEPNDQNYPTNLVRKKNEIVVVEPGTDAD